MLKNIPPILSPELLKVLCEMGHGDRICIGDGNFPGASMAKANDEIANECVFVRADGHGVNDLLMEKMDCDKDLEIPVWEDYKKTVAKYDERGANAIGAYERFEFYRQARRCYCILQSGETQVYANVILQKGVI